MGGLGPEAGVSPEDVQGITDGKGGAIAEEAPGPEGDVESMRGREIKGEGDEVYLGFLSLLNQVKSALVQSMEVSMLTKSGRPIR